MPISSPVLAPKLGAPFRGLLAERGEARRPPLNAEAEALMVRGLGRRAGRRLRCGLVEVGTSTCPGGTWHRSEKRSACSGRRMWVPPRRSPLRGQGRGKGPVRRPPAPGQHQGSRSGEKGPGTRLRELSNHRTLLCSHLPLGSHYRTSLTLEQFTARRTSTVCFARNHRADREPAGFVSTDAGAVHGTDR